MLLKRIKRNVQFNYNQLKDEIRFAFKKKDKPLHPVFIIGCGRSGTTILGNTLSHHPDISYLNEPRRIWFKAYPELDIWSKKGYNRKFSKLIMDETDFDIQRSEILKREFYKKQIVKNAKVLIEKLPINNFRVEFLRSCFPDAKYIYIKRNGIEVAKSIEKIIPYNWFGYENLKYKLIEEYAKASGNYDQCLSAVKNDFQKGLFEWRISMDLSEKFFSKMEKENYISLTYDNLTHDPVKEINNIIEFLNLTKYSSLDHYVEKTIKRKTSRPNYNKMLTKENLLIGGERIKELS